MAYLITALLSFALGIAASVTVDWFMEDEDEDNQRW